MPARLQQRALKDYDSKHDCEECGAPSPRCVYCDSCESFDKGFANGERFWREQAQQEIDGLKAQLELANAEREQVLARLEVVGATPEARTVTAAVDCVLGAWLALQQWHDNLRQEYGGVCDNASTEHVDMAWAEVDKEHPRPGYDQAQRLLADAIGAASLRRQLEETEAGAAVLREIVEYCDGQSLSTTPGDVDIIGPLGKRLGYYSVMVAAAYCWRHSATDPGEAATIGPRRCVVEHALAVPTGKAVLEQFRELRCRVTQLEATLADLREKHGALEAIAAVADRRLRTIRDWRDKQWPDSESAHSPAALALLDEELPGLAAQSLQHLRELTRHAHDMADIANTRARHIIDLIKAGRALCGAAASAVSWLRQADTESERDVAQALTDTTRSLRAVMER